MTIAITEATIKAAYELLRTCEPFLGWKLPEPSELVFMVLRSSDYYGDCDGSKIRISSGRHGQLNTLLATVAHEMIHLHQMRRKLETENTQHNEDFIKRAAKVCRIHGFDFKTF